MALNRTALFLIGNILTVMALSELNLDCTNEFEDVIHCGVNRTNCTGYSLTVMSNLGKKEKKNCSLQECGVAQCCCSVEMLTILGDWHTVTVWERGRSLMSKSFGVQESMKPKTPTIFSVNESNGNFEVKFDTKMTGVAANTLTTEVTYFKKGDVQLNITLVKPTTVDGLSYYKIPGRELEPSTTYTVRVRSLTYWSNKSSDSSNDRDFKTPASSDSPFLAVIIILCVVAVILSSVMYICLVKVKTKWWDVATKHLKPKLEIVHSSEQKLLKPVPAIISSISVDAPFSDDSKPWSTTSDSSGESLLQSSGISPGSLELTYASAEPVNIIAGVQDALCKAFPNISPISQLTTPPLPETNSDRGSGTSGFVNRTYSIVIPSSLQQNMYDCSEVQKPAETLCDSSYRSIDAEVVENHHQQALACPLPALQDILANSSFMPTDMSYQPCQADPGRFTEDLFSVSSGSNTAKSSELVSGVETGYRDEAISTALKMNSRSKDDLLCEENPCSECMPAGSQSFTLVDDDYQAFQSLVGQPDVLPSDEKRSLTGTHLDRQDEESSIEIPQNLPNSINNSQADQNPFIHFLSVEPSMSIITDSGYQCV